LDDHIHILPFFAFYDTLIYNNKLNRKENLMPITRMCKNCGKSVTRSPSLMNGKNIFCNRKCKIQHLRNNPLMGKNNPSWRGGKIITELGYIRIRNQNHPRAVNGYVLEHIIVMENKIGRPLKKGERIHHIDHNPANNHPDNLKLYASNGQHLKKEGHHRKKHSPCPCGKPHKGHGLCTRHLGS
jgi:hypothetical protein